MNIIEFLEARIAEDEAAAQSAARASSGDRFSGASEPVGPAWEAEDGLILGGTDKQGYRIALWDCEGSSTLCMDPATASHAARHDPARVLAECAAKRAIIEAFDPAAPDLDPYVGRDVIAMLATVHKGHPDYQQEWA